MNRYLFYVFILLGFLARLVMLVRYEFVSGGEVDVYLADEGVVGLMGMHILEGRELPVFFYGQDYLGALEAYLVAASFALFGVGFGSLRLVPFGASLLLLALVYRFTRRTYSVDAARWATALVSVAPVYFLQWNLKARGGFVEHIVLLVIVMALFWRCYLYGERNSRLATALGLVAGVALWVNQLMLAYLAVFAALLAWLGDRRSIAVLTAATALGASLLISYNVMYPLATARSLGRKAVVLNRVPVEQRDEDWVLRGVAKRFEAMRHGADKLGLVFGVPPREGVERLGLTPAELQGTALTGFRRMLWPIPVLLFGWAVFASVRRRRLISERRLASEPLLALLLFVTFVVGYVSPRYMLPAYPLAAIMAAVLMIGSEGYRRSAAISGIAFVLVFNVLGWADLFGRPAANVAVVNDDDGRGDRLLAALEQQGLTRCYSAGPLYHLVFASGERVVMSPLQKDRYPAYNDEVEASPSVCYVFREDQQKKRQHIAMMDFLESRGVRYDTTLAPPYRILHGLAPREVITGDAIGRVRRLEPPRSVAQPQEGSG